MQHFPNNPMTGIPERPPSLDFGEPETLEVNDWKEEPLVQSHGEGEGGGRSWSDLIVHGPETILQGALWDISI